MNLNLKTDELIPLAQVPRLRCWPRRRNGKKLHAATVHRWAQQGVRGIRLAVVQCGGTRCTTIGALEDFLRRLSEIDGGKPQTATRQGQLERVEQALDQAGL